MLELRTLADALVSGRYTQAFGDIGVGDRLCVIGVAYRLAGLDWRYGDEDVHNYGLHTCGWACGPYVEVRDDMLPALRRAHPHLARLARGTNRRWELAALNDRGLTFQQLAALIYDGLVTVRELPPEEPESMDEEEDWLAESLAESLELLGDPALAVKIYRPAPAEEPMTGAETALVGA